MSRLRCVRGTRPFPQSASKTLVSRIALRRVALLRRAGTQKRHMPPLRAFGQTRLADILRQKNFGGGHQCGPTDGLKLQRRATSRPAVLAIGRPDFPNILIDTLRRQAGVGHCMVFALTRTGAASCLLDAGNIPTGSDLGAAYAGQFHESDPNRDALFEGEGSAPIVLPSFAPRMYGARYRKIFFNDF